VLDTARGLEGLIRQAGVHAAGVIMSSEPVIDHIPVWKREADGAIITQFDYPACESLGLLKMDFLGLRNLTVLDDAVTGIRDNRGQDTVLETLPLDDKPTYELLARGDTLGVFQLDGGSMRALLRSMHADRFEDIGAEAGRLHPRQGRPAAQGHGQEEEGDHRQGVRAVRGGHEGERVQRLRDHGDLGCPGPVLRLRVQPGARGLLRDGRLLDRLPQGELPGRVHGRPAHLDLG
jgi:hypothetical protein